MDFILMVDIKNVKKEETFLLTSNFIGIKNINFKRIIKLVDVSNLNLLFVASFNK